MIRRALLVLGAVAAVAAGAFLSGGAPAETRVGAGGGGTPASSEAVGRGVERSDNVASFSYSADGAHAADSSLQMLGPDGLVFYVYGRVEGGVAVVYASLANQGGQEVGFPGGLEVLARITRDGQPWRDVTMGQRVVRTLPPGQTVEVASTVPLDRFGRHEVTGEVAVSYD